MCKIGYAYWNVNDDAYGYENQWEQQFKYIMISFIIFTQLSSNVLTYTSGIDKAMGKLSESICTVAHLWHSFKSFYFYISWWL